MIMPCVNKIDCEGSDAPIANLSAEGPDRLRFFGRFYGETCVGTCTSIISQEDADLCAARIECLVIDVYYSAEKTCACPDDPTITYTVEAGAFIAITQAEADALAEQFICSFASIVCGGPPVEIFFSTAQTCVTECENGSVSVTTISHTFRALTQAEADELASRYTCQIAELTCGGGVSQAQNSEQTCTSTCPDGAIFSYTVPAGLFTAPNQAQANEEAYSFACQKAIERRFCIGPLGPACQNEAFAGSVTVSRVTDTTEDSWSIYTGAIPSGLTFDALVSGQSASLTGTPTTVGDSTFGIQIVENDPDIPGAFGVLRKAFTFTVNQCTEPSVCPEAIQGELTTLSERSVVREQLAAASPFYALMSSYEGEAGRAVEAAYAAVGFSPVFYFTLKGTASGGGANTLINATQSWPLNIFAGMALVVIDGTGAPFATTIYNNDGTTLYTNDNFSSVPDATTQYAIVLATGTSATEYVPEFNGTISVEATTASANDIGDVDVQFTCCNADAEDFPIIATPSQSIAFDSLSDKIFGNNLNNLSIEVMDATAKTLITSLPYSAWSDVLVAGQNAVMRSPGDGLIYSGMEITGGAATLRERVHVIDPATHTELINFALSRQGANPSNLATFAYDPVRTRMYAMCRNSNRIDSSGVIDQIDTLTSRKWYSGLYMPQSDVMWFGSDTGSNGTFNIYPIDPTTNPPTVLETTTANGGYLWATWPTHSSGQRITKMINLGFDNWFALCMGGILSTCKVPSAYAGAGLGISSLGITDFTVYVFTSIVDIHYRASNGLIYISSTDAVRTVDVLTATFAVLDCRFPGGYFAEDSSGNLLLSGPCIQYID